MHEKRLLGVQKYRHRTKPLPTTATALLLLVLQLNWKQNLTSTPERKETQQILTQFKVEIKSKNVS